MCRGGERGKIWKPLQVESIHYSAKISNGFSKLRRKRLPHLSVAALYNDANRQKKEQNVEEGGGDKSLKIIIMFVHEHTFHSCAKPPDKSLQHCNLRKYEVLRETMWRQHEARIVDSSYYSD